MLANGLDVLPRNICQESGDGPRPIRLATDADSAGLLPGLDPGAMDADDVKNLVWHTRGFANARLRLYAGGEADAAEGLTADITLIGQRPPSSQQKPGSTDKGEPGKGKCRVILKGTVTFGGSVTEGKNPVTGETTTDVDWYEASSISFTGGFRAGGVILDPEPADQVATGYQQAYEFDLKGDEKVYLQWDDIDEGIDQVVGDGQLVS